MEHRMAHWRKELLRDTAGEVLEIGVGTWKNLPHYPQVASLTGIDFSPKMVNLARGRITELGVTNARVLLMDAQKLKFPENSFDTVVTSCVFCSVPDPVQGLKEIRRVCKEGGKVLMLEHVRSEKPYIGPLMDMLNPIPVHLYGANINRRTALNLRKAGFTDISVKDLWSDILKKIVVINRK